MTMTLTTLGGSSAWPSPGQGCSSYLIEDGQTSVVIDCGPDTLLELRRHIDYRSVDAVIISHCHADHILDLVPYRYGLQYGAGSLDRKIPVWLPPGGFRRMEMLASAFDGQGEESANFWSRTMELVEYDPETTLGIGDFTLSFAPTQHFIECYAMRIADPTGTSIAYSADTGIVDPLVPLFTGADIAVVEATLESQTATPRSKRGHLTPEDAGRLARMASVGRLVLTHLWSERPDAVVIEAARQEFDGEILVAKPGQCLHV